MNVLLSRYATYATHGLVACAVAGYLSAQGPFIHKIKETFQMYKDGYPVKMDQDILGRCQDVLRKARIAKASKPDIQFFLMSGDEPFTFGSVNNGFHSGIVGLPWNFTYKSIKDIDPTELRAIDGQPIKWDSTTGQKLIDSLVLSPKAQNFVIMREIYMLDNYKLYTIPLMMALNTIFARSLIQNINTKERFWKMSLVTRVYGKCLVISLFLLSFLATRDISHCYHQSKADIMAVGHGNDYYDGAVEYYGKVLQRNKAFSKMLGDDGPNYFTEDGDEKFSFLKFIMRCRQLPITKRLNAINDHMTAHFDD